LADRHTLESRGTTVLLVDDQPFIGEAVRRMLVGEEDISFHFCSDASAALQAATPKDHLSYASTADNGIMINGAVMFPSLNGQ
jgi:CheY-like chemotaxis protein